MDLDARIVERWRPGDDRSEVLNDSLHWRPDQSVEPLRVDLAAFFTQVLGEQ